MTEQTFKVGQLGDFPENSMTPLTVGEQEIVLVHQGGKFYALPDQCTHARYPLHDGELLVGKLKCQYHGATFDLETGRPSLPAVKKIRLFEVVIQDEDVYVSLQET